MISNALDLLRKQLSTLLSLLKGVSRRENVMIFDWIYILYDIIQNPNYERWSFLVNLYFCHFYHQFVFKIPHREYVNSTPLHKIIRLSRHPHLLHIPHHAAHLTKLHTARRSASITPVTKTYTGNLTWTGIEMNCSPLMSLSCLTCFRFAKTFAWKLRKRDFEITTDPKV